MIDKPESPKAILLQMKETFSENTINLFNITINNFFEYESALYGLIVAKPSKAISAALGIQKEVVVLVTNFENLQVRTVHAAKRVIDESEGRYESNVALVVHKDFNGDMNLKNWGREQGVSILYLFFIRMDCQQVKNLNVFFAMNFTHMIHLMSLDQYQTMPNFMEGEQKLKTWPENFNSASYVLFWVSERSGKLPL